MIVYDFDIARTGRIAVPTKADAPLIVDPDAPLSAAISLELFKPVPREIRDIGQTRRCTQPIQHPFRPWSKRLELLDPFASGKSLGPRIREA
ncbi:MAG: hypothetical protein WDM81_00475 [Rhizomicrobium sp.]